MNTIFAVATKASRKKMVVQLSVAQCSCPIKEVVIIPEPRENKNLITTSLELSTTAEI